MPLHCWHDQKTHIEETFGFHSDEHLQTYADNWVGGTCMLEDGHAGAHKFTSDARIGVTFATAGES
jgi:hypothetical protein